MKEPSTLPDIQLLKDDRNIALSEVGISDFLIPITIAAKNRKKQHTSGRLTFSVFLCETFKGIHMSRLVRLAAEYFENVAVEQSLESLLEEARKVLHTSKACAALSFDYFLEKKSPVSNMTSPMGYRVCLFGKLGYAGSNSYEGAIKVTVPVSTLCPCSKAISDFGAHNQRTDVNLTLQLKNGVHLPLEELVAIVENASSCPLFPVLRREDEKYVTEKQYANPKFVEDLARDIIEALRTRKAVAGFELEITSLESIHAHNARVFHSEVF